MEREYSNRKGYKCVLANNIFRDNGWFEVDDRGG